MSTQPWQPLKWCLLCTDRRTDDVLCPSCMAELDMRVAAIVGEEPARFDDMLAVIENAHADNENTRDC